MFRFAALFAVLVFSVLAGSANAAERNLNILVVSTFGKDIPAQDGFERGLDHALHYRAGIHNVVFEFMDGPRIPTADSVPALTALFHTKYRSITWDLVIAWGRPASKLVIDNSDVFGDCPRIHVEMQDAALKEIAGSSSRDAAVNIGNDHRRALETALTATNARKVVVIGESKSAGAAARLAEFRRSTEDMGDKIEFSWILDQTLDQVEAQVASLSNDSLVYYLLMFSDGAGRRMTPYAIAQKITAKSAVPVFSQWESLMGSGIVGGYMLSIELTGQNVGFTALSLLGEPQPLPQSYFRTVFDWRALQHWSMAETNLPLNSTIINRPANPFRQYRTEIAALACVIVMLTLFSVFLARLLRSRNKALALLDLERKSLTDRVAERTSELDSKAAELSRSNQELESFAFAVSHDLRSPVRTLSAYSKLLSRSLGDTLEDDARDLLKFIHQGAAQMDGMILGLLEYSRVGHLPQDSFRPLSLETAVKQAIELLAKAIHDAHAEIVSNLPADLPQIVGEPGMMARLFQNLLENALKYRRPDVPAKIRISAEINGAQLIVTVEDNGIGIPEDQRLRVFALFQRLNGAVGDCGYGVGLALCRRIVQIHDGEIWVEDSPGGGCRLRFSLPVK